MLDAAAKRRAQRHRAPPRHRRHLHPARRSQSRPAQPAPPPPCFSRSKPPPEIFRRGSRLPACWTRILPGGCAKAPEPMQPRAAQRALPAASISKTKYAPDFPRVASTRRNLAARRTTAELDRLGLVAPPEEFAPLPASPARSLPGSNRKWPSYRDVRGRCAAQPELARSRHQHRRFYLVHDRGRLGLGRKRSAEMLLVVSEQPKAPRATARATPSAPARRAAAAVRTPPATARSPGQTNTGGAKNIAVLLAMRIA